MSIALDRKRGIIFYWIICFTLDNYCCTYLFMFLCTLIIVSSGEERDPDTSRSERENNDFNRLFDTQSAPLYDDFIIDLDDDLLDDEDMDDMFGVDINYRLLEREISPDSVVRKSKARFSGE